jgi:hypothetical protein
MQTSITICITFGLPHRTKTLQAYRWCVDLGQGADGDDLAGVPDPRERLPMLDTHTHTPWDRFISSVSWYLYILASRDGAAKVDAELA